VDRVRHHPADPSDKECLGPSEEAEPVGQGLDQHGTRAGTVLAELQLGKGLGECCAQAQLLSKSVRPPPRPFLEQLLPSHWTP